MAGYHPAWVQVRSDGSTAMLPPGKGARGMHLQAVSRSRDIGTAVIALGRRKQQPRHSGTGVLLRARAGMQSSRTLRCGAMR
jgi:hypothetical protein